MFTKKAFNTIIMSMYKCYLLMMFAQVAISSYAPYLQIIMRNKGYSYSLCGSIIALAQAMAIVVPLLVSSLSDKTGRTKPFLLTVAISCALCALPAILLDNVIVVIIFASLMNGAFWCINPLCDGFVNRAIVNTKTSYGTLRALGTFSYMIALVVFAFSHFPDETNNKSILSCFIVCMSILIFVIALQKDDKREKKKEEKRKLFSISWFPTRYYIFMGIIALTRLSQAVIERHLATYMTEELKVGRYFTLFVALGALFEFICLIVVGRLLKNKKTTPYFMLIISSLAMALRLWLYLIPGIVPFAIGQTLHGLTFGVSHVAATTYTAENVDPLHYELGMTIYWSCASNLPEMITAFLGGIIIESWGYKSLFSIYSIIPLIALLLLFINRRRINNEKA